MQLISVSEHESGCLFVCVLVCPRVELKKSGAQTAVASAVVPPSATRRECGSVCIWVPRGCKQAPDQYSISVVSPHITFPYRAARWAGSSERAAERPRITSSQKVTRSGAINNSMLANVLQRGGDSGEPLMQYDKLMRALPTASGYVEAISCASVCLWGYVCYMFLRK